MEQSIKVLLRTDGGFLRKEPIKAGFSKAVEIPGTKAKCLGIEFRIFELVQLSNLQNGVESLNVLKSVRLKWDNKFSLLRPCLFNL